MKLKFPEALSHFYNSAGNEFKRDADGNVETDHPDTITEMIKAGFEKIEAGIKEFVQDAEVLLMNLFHHGTGEALGQVGGVPEVGTKLSVHEVMHEVVEVNTDKNEVWVKPLPVVAADQVKAAVEVHFKDADTGVEVHKVTMPVESTPERVRELAEEAFGTNVRLGDGLYKVERHSEDGTEVHVRKVEPEQEQERKPEQEQEHKPEQEHPSGSTSPAQENGQATKFEHPTHKNQDETGNG